MNFAVGVVLYNSQPQKINIIIDEYYSFTKKIILVDNGSKNIEEVEDNIKNKSKVVLIKNNKNEGIAKALNQILDEANKNNVNFLLTLDQDSFLKYEDLEKMYKYINKNVAIVCPEILDLNKKKNKTIINEFEEIERCITSGSFMNLDVCNKIGQFEEKMFIDYVDFEYCKRIRLEGYKILKIKGCFLKHEIGKRTTRKFFGIDVYPTNHSGFRVYYYFRNMHYYYIKFKENMTVKEKINEIVRMCWKYISIILYEENKLEKLQKAKRGFKDAKKMK